MVGFLIFSLNLFELFALLQLLQGRQPVTALTWGHNDRRIFVAVGCDVLTVVVLKRVASLQLLCGRRIQQRLIDESSIFLLPLPNKLQAAITELFTPTIKVTHAQDSSPHLSLLYHSRFSLINLFH